MTDPDLTTIADKLESTAFNLFRDWTAECSRQFPERHIVISDESLLVRDLKASISSALRALREKESKEPGWEIGFFFGFTESNLAAHWYHEYIRKQSNDYRMIVMLQALNSQLLQKRDIVSDIEQDYMKRVLKDCNFPVQEYEILADLETAQMHLEMPILAKLHNALDSDLFTCLDNYITRSINALTREEEESQSIHLHKYLSGHTVSQLIERNR